ncbi:ORF V: Enzymatic polyprotein [Labeo rohita]|uniref:ORF V: Enzymatic polyprotein n=1 Tax=Labeo rohita TaxID=84645 RepID=A0ABQ8MZW7_LABRO|nr:ORF V: Enzymatic polyprotein [Labeo rohita]
MSRHPLSSSRGKSLSCQGFSATAARHLGDIQVTVQNSPSAPKAPRTSVSLRGPIELPEQCTSPYSGEGEPGGEADDSADQYPSAVAAPSETDAELSAMLLRAAKEIGLEVPKTPPADPSRLDDWFLGRAPAAPRRNLHHSGPGGSLFGDTVEDFAQQFSAVQKQTEAIKHILPRRDIPSTSVCSSPRAPPPRPQRNNQLRTLLRCMTPDWQPDVELPAGEGQPGGGGNRSLGDDNINVPTPGGGPGAAVCSDAAVGLRVGGTHKVTERANFLTSGVQAPSSLFEQRPRSVSSDSDSEPDVVSAGTREEVPFPFPPQAAPLRSRRSIEPVPPAEMKSGFYSPYFIVPKKSGGLRPILDLRALNRSLLRLPFKMLTTKRMLTCIHGLVRSHRPEGRVLSRLDPASTQTLPTVCFRGSSVSVQSASIWPLPLFPCLYESRGGCPVPSLADGHSHPQLSRRLASHSSLARSVVRTKGLGALAPQPSGPSGQPREEQTLPSAEDLFSRCGAGLGQYDSPPHQRVGAEVSGVIQTQNSGPSQNISEAPGAYGSRSRSDAARLASYETASALVTRSSPEMGMAPWHTPDWRFPPQCHRLFSPWSDPASLQAGVPLGQVSRHLVVYTDASSTGWGAVCNGQAASGSWTGPRLQWHINCLELLAVLLALRRFRPTLRHKHVLVRTDSTATVAYINRQGAPMESDVAEIATCRSHSRRTQPCS